MGYLPIQCELCIDQELLSGTARDVLLRRFPLPHFTKDINGAGVYVAH